MAPRATRRGAHGAMRTSSGSRVPPARAPYLPADDGRDVLRVLHGPRPSLVKQRADARSVRATWCFNRWPTKRPTWRSAQVGRVEPLPIRMKTARYRVRPPLPIPAPSFPPGCPDRGAGCMSNWNAFLRASPTRSGPARAGPGCDAPMEIGDRHTIPSCARVRALQRPARRAPPVCRSLAIRRVVGAIIENLDRCQTKLLSRVLRG
jgi:hypothetical protein